MKSTYGLYLAVLPRYRRECMSIVKVALGEELTAWVSDSHLDRSVKTDRGVSWYRRVAMFRLLGDRCFFQVGGIRSAVGVDNLVLDLNPRSLNAWVLLILRRLLRRRVLVWGHLYPRAGRGARTASLRMMMRRLANGTVSYTYSDAETAREDLPGEPVWVAPNAMYRMVDISPAVGDNDRDSVLYVGRLEEAKKVHLLIRGFSFFHNDFPQLRLVLVGDGSCAEELRCLVEELGLSDSVDFLGWIDDPVRLRVLYSSCIASVSPGFAGLALTQSAGYGIPMVVANNEQHSPEIELASWGAVRWFDSDDPVSLAKELGNCLDLTLPDLSLSSQVRQRYSAEAMGEGLIAALKNVGGQQA